MNKKERFIAICNGEKPDYYPIFGFNDAPGVSGGVMRVTYDRLLSTGMPDIGGVWEMDGMPRNLDGWRRYWGVDGPLEVTEFPERAGEGLKYKKYIENGFEFVECETGMKTKQILDNDISYSMPEFISFHVKDREGWEFYKEKTALGAPFDAEQIKQIAKKYEDSDRPVSIRIASTFSAIRDLMGPEKAMTVFYDDPELAKDILDYQRDINRRFYFPLIKAIKPEIVYTSEDLCYNHGMFISPAMFTEYCAPAYREIGEIAKETGVTMVAVDTDGFAEELVPLIEECGANAIFPWEVKSNNDLFRVREKHPEFIMLGGLEKEVLNEGNESLIEEEIMSKVPSLLKTGRYFPNGDHGIQPFVTFENLCKFMTLLHEICNNPEGQFPRMAL